MIERILCIRKRSSVDPSLMPCMRSGTVRGQGRGRGQWGGKQRKRTGTVRPEDDRTKDEVV